MSQSAAASRSELEPERRSKVKILLVDDQPDNLLALEAALEVLDEELVRAQSGMEALRCLLEHDFAAILLDVKMPEMDGFETAALIRQRDRSRHTPILFLTGYKNEDQLYQGYYLGAVDYLFKPIIPEILRSKVQVFVELSRNAELLRRNADALAIKNAELERSIVERRKAEERFRALLEAAPDAMVITNEEGVITLVNSRASEVFGYGRDELVGKAITSLAPDWWRHLDWKPASPTQPRTMRIRVLRADGSEFPAEVTLSPLETEEGLLYTSAFRDVTEREQAEASIRELNTELERRVQERTAELTRSNDELRQFAYIASHDLQEPLRMVASYTQLLQRRYRGKLDDEADEFIEFAVNGVHRMRSLINDLLAFSRIDAREIRGRRVQMNEALREAMLNLKLSIDESGAVIESEPLIPALADHVQMVQVFQNLIGNAIKYRSARPLHIHIASRREGSEVLYSVTDNGIGIERQYWETIFRIFKRLHGKQLYPGNGMGLAICKKIVERHKGRIGVESTKGVGSTFWFALPAASGG